MPPTRARTHDRRPDRWILAAGLLAACAAAPVHLAAGPPPEAAAAFAAARALHEGGADADDPALWRALARARQMAPDWVPPRRLEDDLLRAEHLEVEALERRRAERAARPASALAHYLTARLEAELDPRAFAQIVQLDPDFAWGRHAWAFARSLAGDDDGRIALDWRRAVLQACTPWEAAHFTRGLAEYFERNDREGQALELLERALAELDLLRADRARLAAELAMLELRLGNLEGQRKGYERALSLVRSDALSDQILEQLVAALEGSFALGDPGGQRLELALAALDTPLRRRLAARRSLRLGDAAEAEFEFLLQSGPQWRELLDEFQDPAWLFRQGHFARALEVWLAALPGQVLAGDGLPADPGLRRLVQAGRSYGSTGSSADLALLGRRLLEAGWYAEALPVARALRRTDLPLAMDLRRQALAGRVLFATLGEALVDVERGRDELLLETSWEEPLGEPTAGGQDSLGDLLRRWAAAFARCASEQGESLPMAAAREAFAASPRLDYGPFASLVHPGPTFSAADELAGLGPAGRPVPGLAQAMDRHGRFAIVGAALGDKPDATVLRRLHVEELSGELLGTAWAGTLAWCEGVEVQSRAQRGGAHISGAALHEGFWIDLEEVRDLHARWLSLARQYAAPGSDGESPARERAERRIERVLGSGGLRLLTPPAESRRRARERTAIAPALGQSARVRLAVLRERAEGGALLGQVGLSEVVDLIATHEQGHLCERTRFLPLTRHWGRLLIFLLEHGFSASAIQQRLEYRAQLVALCSISDPRLALVDLLEAAEARSDGGLEHGPAYRELLADVLAELDADLQGRPESWPRLSAEHTLLHQLHRLGPEELRGLALRVARRPGRNQVQGGTDQTDSSARR
jgi:hypothetical protein